MLPSPPVPASLLAVLETLHVFSAPSFATVGVPWCIAAGWALDPFRGEQSRPHRDLEITVPAAGFPEIRHRFPECVFDAVGSGRV